MRAKNVFKHKSHTFNPKPSSSQKEPLDHTVYIAYEIKKQNHGKKLEVDWNEKNSASVQPPPLPHPTHKA